jgi:hypothetical protein
MVVTDAGSGRPDPASRRERALTRRIERLRADLANGEFEKATLRRERDAAQQRAEAAERRLHEVRAETSARTAELETVAAVAEIGRKSAEPSFPVTRPGYSRPQVNRFVSWALSGRFKLRPTARFELKDAGYSPADVHSYVESVAAGLNPAVKEKVLAELTLARQQ